MNARVVSDVSKELDPLFVATQWRIPPIKIHAINKLVFGRKN